MMKSENNKQLYHYPCTDGRVVLASTDLAYALNPAGKLDLEQVVPGDKSRLSILPNNDIALLLALALDNSPWESPVMESGEAPPVTENILDIYHHYCRQNNGKLYILNGNEYVQLEKFIAKADKFALAYMLTQVVTQAVMCQISLAKQQPTAMQNADTAESA